MRAARVRIDEPAIYHQNFAGNCFENTGEACWANGIGKAPFDCSGFVITAICDAAGVDTGRWPQVVRHVRDFWDVASEGLCDMRQTSQQVGGLWVTSRHYTLQGERRKVAGHIGVITEVTSDALEILHASPKRGKVETKRLSLATAARSLGTIMLSDINF